MGRVLRETQIPHDRKSTGPRIETAAAQMVERLIHATSAPI